MKILKLRSQAQDTLLTLWSARHSYHASKRKILLSLIREMQISFFCIFVFLCNNNWDNMVPYYWLHTKSTCKHDLTSAQKLVLSADAFYRWAVELGKQWVRSCCSWNGGIKALSCNLISTVWHRAVQNHAISFGGNKAQNRPLTLLLDWWLSLYLVKSFVDIHMFHIFL